MNAPHNPAIVTIVPEPQQTAAEAFASRVRLLADLDSDFVRGWRAGDDPGTQALVAEVNAREQARCTAALQARLRKLL